MSWERQLELKIEECRAAFKEAEARRLAASVDEDRALRALKGYEAALEYERQHNGAGSYMSDPPRAVSEQAPDIPANANTERASVNTLGSDDLEEASPNKAGFIREFIGKHEAMGVTPAEIYSATQTAGIRLHRNYVYSVLQRGKAAGTIRVRRGKYFLVTEAEMGKQTSA
jgi:hypothetical protein